MEFTRSEIMEQLGRMLSFQQFQNSAILSKFLRYIVEEKLEGRSSFIKEYTIATNVLSRNNNYDPQSDASVRIHAGRLRRALQKYYSDPGKSDKILIHVPKGTYVPEFELLTAAHLGTQPGFGMQKPTLAILPLQLHEAESLQALWDGLCDQLCTEFVNHQEISVVSYYSSRRVAQMMDDLRQCGQMLEADYLLTGSIQTDALDIRIRFQLTRTESQHIMWAWTYEKTKANLNIFDIQDEVVRRVVNQLGGTFGVIPRDSFRPGSARPFNVSVFNAVHWFYNLVGQIDQSRLSVGLTIMKETVRIDPDFALGWAILGETYVAGHFFGYDCQTPEPLKEALRCGKMALQLDPYCHHGYQTVSLAHVFMKQREDCLRTVEKWISLDKYTASTSGGLGFCLICAGQIDEGAEMIRNAIDLNPLYPWWWNAGMSFYHFGKGEHNESIYWADMIQGQSAAWTAVLKAASYERLGKMKEATAAVITLDQAIPPGMSYDRLIGAFLLPVELESALLHSLKTIKEHALVG